MTFVSAVARCGDAGRADEDLEGQAPGEFATRHSWRGLAALVFARAVRRDERRREETRTWYALCGACTAVFHSIVPGRLILTSGYRVRFFGWRRCTRARRSSLSGGEGCRDVVISLIFFPAGRIAFDVQALSVKKDTLPVSAIHCFPSYVQGKYVGSLTNAQRVHSVADGIRRRESRKEKRARVARVGAQTTR